MSELKSLFEEKVQLLQKFCSKTELMYGQLKLEKDTEKRIDLIDDLSSEREETFRLILALDQRIEAEKMLTSPSEFERLSQDSGFRKVLEEMVTKINNIQLTDQSLFLYIQSIGGDVRADILRQIKEKQTVSKYKSQGSSTTGEGLDKTL